MDKMIFRIQFLKNNIFNIKSIPVLVSIVLLIYLFSLISNDSLSNSIWSDIIYVLTNQSGFFCIFLLPFLYLCRNIINIENEIIIYRFKDFKDWINFQTINIVIVSLIYCILYFGIVFFVLFLCRNKNLNWFLDDILYTMPGIISFSENFSPMQGILLIFLRYYLILNLICIILQIMIGSKTTIYKYRFIIVAIIYFCFELLQSYSIPFVDFDCNVFKYYMESENYLFTCIMLNIHYIFYFAIYYLFVKDILIKKLEVFYDESNQ